MAQNNTFDIFRLDLVDFDVINIDFYSSIQARLKKYGEEFSTYAQAVWGKPFSNFLDSAPGYNRMDDTWQPVRALGKGGFGMVGLWEKRNRQGVVQDSIAIKEMDRDLKRDYHLDRNPHLAREAVIMKQLNDAEQRHGWATQNNILCLRSFKYFPQSSKWRFYLEFAEYGDLHKLIYAYKAWDTHLPEEFLWHVFYSLAKVAVVMEQGPFTNLETKDPNDGPVIHLDIKPDNIYMGKPDGRALFAQYPTIKVADFGLSEVTNESDLDNPRMYRKGTPEYLPPEQTCFTVHWNRRPDGIQHDPTQQSVEDAKAKEKGMREPGYKFLSAHNVWGFGKLMYDMMTLAWSYGLDDKMDRYTTEARYYGAYNEHAIPEIRTKKKPEYSSSLRDLIRECLHIKIAKRPTPQQLLEHIQSGLAAMVRSRQEDAGEPNGPRVYHMGNEINHMPVGDAGLTMTRDEWKVFRADHWLNPLWQPLLSGRWAEKVRNGELVKQPIEEGGPKRERRPINGTVKPDPRPLDAFLNHRGVIWKLRSSSLDGDLQGENEDNGDNDRRQREIDYQNEIADRIRKSGPHDTRELSPKPNDGGGAKLADTFEEARTSMQRAADRLAAMAGEMVHPGDVPPSQIPRIILHPPGEASNHQPRPKRKRKRAMGISIDENFQEAEGRVVRGHNLRKRRG